jgi:hypothetical protein
MGFGCGREGLDAGWFFVVLQKREELIHCDASGSDKGTQSAGGQFGMLRNRKVLTNAGFRHDQMAADLATNFPPDFWKAFTASFPEMFASIPNDLPALSYGMHNYGCGEHVEKRAGMRRRRNLRAQTATTMGD